MVMELDPRTVKFKSELADVIGDFIEDKEHKGEISKQDRNNWYAAFGKYLPDLRTRVITKEDRRKEAEEMKAQRLGMCQSKSVFNLKGSSS